MIKQLTEVPGYFLTRPYNRLNVTPAGFAGGGAGPGCARYARFA